jgi:hypothetical protein
MATELVKLPDWQDRLAECVRGRIGRGFEWGTNDCMAWAADCVLAQTGHDDWERYRGRYSTPRGALRAIRRGDGCALPIDLMDRLWGLRLPVHEAIHGDLVVANLGEPAGMGPSVGLCYGLRSLFVGTDEHGDGLVRLDTLTLEHCYRPWASSQRPSRA